MAEPATSTAALFSVAKAWSILAGVCGSLIPILAFADSKPVTFKQASFMALTGCSFSTFVGPWLADKIGFHSIDAIVALSWALGVVGVYFIRAVLRWLENRGEQAIDNVIGKVTGTPGTVPTIIAPLVTPGQAPPLPPIAETYVPEVSDENYMPPFKD